MFGIGDFARHGRVSVRMLRHHDTIGLLRPAEVDPVTGYRTYEASQLARLNPVSQPMYPELMARLAHAGVPIVGAPISYYEDAEEGDGAVVVHATAPVAVEPDDKYDFAIVDLPGIATAATVLHHGAMDNVVPTGQALERWIETNGYRSIGYVREVYLDCPPDLPKWVTELQAPVERA